MRMLPKPELVLAFSINLDEGTGQISGLHELEPCPTGLVITPAGDYIVVDQKTAVVKVFDHRGEFLHYYGHKELRSPLDVTMTSSGKVVVTDTAAGHLTVFSHRGQLLSTSEVGMHIVGPRGVDYNRQSKELAVCDAEVGCVFVHDPRGIVKQVLISPDSMSPTDSVPSDETPKGNYHKPPSRSTQNKTPHHHKKESQVHQRPSYVKIDPSSGMVYVSDTGLKQVAAYSHDGQPVWTSTSDMDCPTGICLSPSGEIWVADSSMRCVHRFNKIGCHLGLAVTWEDGLGDIRALGFNSNEELVLTEADTGLVKVYKFNH